MKFRIKESGLGLNLVRTDARAHFMIGEALSDQISA